MKRILLLIIITLSITTLTVATINSQTYSYQPTRPNHPDGVVGKLSVNINFSNHTIKKRQGELFMDMQQYRASVSWVVIDQFTFVNKFQIRHEDSITYKFTTGGTFYFINPILSNKKKNPDGPIGAPSFSILGSVRFDSESDTKRKTFIQSAIIIPVMPMFSLFGGYTYYDEILPTDLNTYFGGFTLYLSEYSENNPYENPDTPLSGFACKVTGGSSINGKFAQLELMIPASKSITIEMFARGEHLDPPYYRAYTGGLGISIYSGK